MKRATRKNLFSTSDIRQIANLARGASRNYPVTVAMSPDHSRIVWGINVCFPRWSELFDIVMPMDEASIEARLVSILKGWIKPGASLEQK